MKLRPYASFWEWPDKNINEAGIMQDYLRAQYTFGLSPYALVQEFKPDPPDFVAVDASGRTIAIELTELVSEEAIEQNIRAQSPEDGIYRDWRPDEVLVALNDRLREKDKKTYGGGPYHEIHVVIHTDEPVISYLEYNPYLRAKRFTNLNRISRAYLLLSYESRIESYPLIELRLDTSR